MRLVCIISAVIIGCCISATPQAQQVRQKTLPHILIYKTKAHYSQYVPVELSADKTKVVSSPDPADIKTGGASLPVLLHKGYLLDRRGISRNTVFIKMTYQEYGTRKNPLGPDELYKLIIDKSPITIIYDCGIRDPQKNSIAQLDLLIDKNELKKTFKRIR